MHWFVEKVRSYYNIEPSPSKSFNSFPEALSSFLHCIEYGGVLFTENDVKNVRSGFVLKTSGTTGKSKLALYSFDQFLEKFREVKYNPIKTVMIMGLNHIGGMDVFFSVVSRGGTVIFPEEVTPKCVCQIVEQEKIQFLSMSPTFLNLILLSDSHKFYDISSLKTINFGAEVMSVNLLKRAQQEFPHVEFKQTFGTTETGTMSVVRHPDNPLLINIPDSKVVNSKLYIKSKYGMLGYIGEESPIEDGYFPTGDLVEEHGEYLKILGRQTDVVNIGGEKVLLTEVENCLLEIPFIRDVKVTSEKNLITGNILVAEVIWESELNCKEYIRNHVTDKRFVPSKIKIVEEIAHSNRFKKIRIYDV